MDTRYRCLFKVTMTKGKEIVRPDLIPTNSNARPRSKISCESWLAPSMSTMISQPWVAVRLRRWMPCHQLPGSMLGSPASFKVPSVLSRRHPGGHFKRPVKSICRTDIIQVAFGTRTRIQAKMVFIGKFQWIRVGLTILLFRAGVLIYKI
jgi:hypothetical protein